jgi:hypothetical protein
VTRALTIAGYLVAALAAIVLDLAARLPNSRLATIGDVFSKLSSRRVGRVTVMLGWWWVGWHFFVR